MDTVALHRPRRPLVLLAPLCAAALAGLRWSGWLAPTPPSGLGSALYAASVRVKARAASAPRRVPGGVELLLDLSELEGKPVRERVLAELPFSAEKVLPGTVLEIDGSLRSPRAPLAPGGFDRRAALGALGVGARLRAWSWRVESGKVPWRWKAAAAAARLRARLAETFSRRLSPRAAALLSGIVLGQRGALDPELRAALRDAGAVHLIVPSGSNVGFVLAFFFWLGLSLGLPPAARWIAGLLAAGFYGLILGMDAPYLRALLCAAWAAAALALDRDCDGIQALSLAMLTQLVLEPRCLFLRGFQMSYLVAVALLVSRPAERPPENWPRPARLACAAVLAGAVAEMALAPVLASLTGRVPVLGSLSNVLLIPLSGLLLGAGFSLGALACLPWDAPLLLGAAAAEFLASSFREICVFFAALPAATVAWPPMSPAAACAYWLALFGLVSTGTRRRRGLAAALGACLWAAGACSARALRPALEARCLAAGQSRACLVSLGDGRHWWVGAVAPASRTKAALRAAGVSRLDRVLLPPGAARERAALAGLRREVEIGSVAARQTPLKLWAGIDRFEFGGSWGLRVFRGDAEYSLIPVRLARGALRVSARAGFVSVSDWR